MSLPNQNMEFTSLTPLPASDMNKIVENIESIDDKVLVHANQEGKLLGTPESFANTAGYIGGAWKAYNSQPNGWGNVDGGVSYTKIGKTVILSIDLYGTSNSATTTIALPFAAARGGISIVQAKSGASYAPGMALVSGSTCLLYANTTGDGFASSGDKNINGTVIYSTSA